MAGMSVSGVAGVMSAFDELWTFAEELRDTVYIVGTNVEYAVHVEFGTSRMQAQPYLFPAARRVIRSPEKHIGTPEDGDELVRQLALAIEREASDDAPVDTGNLKASIRAEKL